VTNDEAKLVLKAVEGVDSYCSYCFDYVFDRLQATFPGVNWEVAIQEYEKCPNPQVLPSP